MSEEGRSTRVVNTRLPHADAALVEAWALAKGTSVASAVREAVMAAARRELLERTAEVRAV